jgi:hypothetical protein
MYKYKVVQIWPGLIVCKQATVCPGHIWTTLYKSYTMDLKPFQQHKVTVMENMQVSTPSTAQLWQGVPVTASKNRKFNNTKQSHYNKNWKNKCIFAINSKP